MKIRSELLAPDAEVLETVVRWHWHEWSANDGLDLDTWRSRLRTRTRPDGIPFTLVARIDDDPVGCLTVCDDDADSRFAANGPWLSGMFVVGAARNLGVGRRLLRDAASRARRFGVTQLWLRTGEAAQFYERCGYRVAHRKESVTDDSVLWLDL